jgi:hypothetical protein
MGNLNARNSINLAGKLRRMYPILLLQFSKHKVYNIRMPSSGMLRRVALVGNDVSEEGSASTIRVTRIGELGKTLAVTNNTIS